MTELIEDSPWRWRLPPSGAMRVPGIVFATRELLPDLVGDRALEQVANVATLPGIVEASYAMPDIHWGYGFPIGGVAGTDVDDGGVVSPGGVGFDISCGVRLLLAPFDGEQIAPQRSALMDELDREVPKGMRKGGVWHVDDERELRRVLAEGTPYAVQRGFGVEQDLERCEDGGVLHNADPSLVGDRALQRGLHQIGSLGSGNHFVELQVVDRVLDDRAQALGLHRGRVCVMIHSGSRGLGHQVCTDHVEHMGAVMRGEGISVPDRQLSCMPVRSTEGERYLRAMNAAANYARVNRQVLTFAVRRAFERVLGNGDLSLLYDVSHNLAKIEEHDVDGRSRTLCVHRKGATRALPPHHPELPPELAELGQPVLVPGSMGTASYVLLPGEAGGALHSTCHGAGRTMSRTAARKMIRGEELREDLEAHGIAVRAASKRGLAEEAPSSYKDVDAVVRAVELADLSRAVARLVPIGVVKG